MYTTSAKTWARSIAIDSAIIATLVAGIFYSVPYVLQVGVFVLWWIAILGLLASGLMAILPPVLQAAVEKVEAELELMKTIGVSQKAIDSKLKVLEKAKEALGKLWPEKMVRRLAVSRTYLAYHWVSDAITWVLLIIASHPVLASVKVIGFLISCIIGVARKVYTERFAADDKVNEELAQHRKHVVQQNNVAGGDIAGDDIYK